MHNRLDKSGKSLLRQTALFIATSVLFIYSLVFVDLAHAAYTVDPMCSYCHNIYGWDAKSNADWSDWDTVQVKHDTRFDESVISPTCLQCHEIVSATTNQPNLWKQHLDRPGTRNFPSGMTCRNCHHSYSGTNNPLSSTDIATAVTQNDTQCKSCHGNAIVGGDHENFHNTDYIEPTTETSSPIDYCGQCHQMGSTKPGNERTPNLWYWHLPEKGGLTSTTTYPDGMNCKSCHNYSGSKLDKAKIDQAILTNNARCDACHGTHQLDPNIKHRTEFLGDSAACQQCHSRNEEQTSPGDLRPPKDTEPNLQDLHIGKKTSAYPDGMNCVGCHDYTGTKLNKDNVKNAIKTHNNSCNACHEINGLGHEVVHNTRYDSDGSAGLCVSCHPMESTTAGNEGNANLWYWHLPDKGGKESTTTYPDGMTCQGCHDYSGDKLNKADIDTAIATGSKDCKSCHTVHTDPEAKHDTEWIVDKPVECFTCHGGTSSNTDHSNLWTLHLGKKTNTFSYMDCESCHLYNGNYLKKDQVKLAIAEQNTDCTGCHGDPREEGSDSKMHQFDPNYSHRTDFMGEPANCNECHSSARVPAKDSLDHNLQDIHMGKISFTYPNGMTCDSCHIYMGSKLNKADIDTAIAKGKRVPGPIRCNECHRSIGITGHESNHDTDYVEGWPDLSPNCIECHEMASPNTGKPNLWYWHLPDLGGLVKTTTYPDGMTCKSCHSYTGAKLDKGKIDTAIAENNQRCDACHDLHQMDPNIEHRTEFLGDSAACQQCHSYNEEQKKPGDLRQPKDTEPNLQDLHVGKKTSTYPDGMTCKSCHSYTGAKLDKGKIDTAIADNNRKCDACHSINSLSHEVVHNTEYSSGGDSSLCTGCHPMASTQEGNNGTANLWYWHLADLGGMSRTTTYPDGMTCQSCHNYTGDKLSKTQIDNAIATKNKDCKACHTIHAEPEKKHDTAWISNKPVACSTCHGGTSTNTGNSNLWSLHLGKSTNTFMFMDCMSCHTYNGTYLNKNNVKLAIEGNATDCTACHGDSRVEGSGSKMHAFYPNKDHRTDFMGEPANCSACHVPVTAKDDHPNIQDIHMGEYTDTYPTGMNCDSCHMYLGNKLNKVDIDNAIAQGKRSAGPIRCNECHKSLTLNGHERNHDTAYTEEQPPSPNCSDCHDMVSPNTGNANLWYWHLPEFNGMTRSTSYPAGMNCQSCHNYQGNKLDKERIIKAIQSKDKKCAACHDVGQGHIAKHDETDVPDNICANCHVRNVAFEHVEMRQKDCSLCHSSSDLKVTQAIADGKAGINITCNSCHQTGSWTAPSQATQVTEHMTQHDKVKPDEESCTSCHGSDVVTVHVFTKGNSCTLCHSSTRTEVVSTINKGSGPDGQTVNCKDCHGDVKPVHEAFHTTKFNTATTNAESLCSQCHISDATDTGPYSLWKVHLGKKSTSFASMDCDSCHNYTGTKLSKADIDQTIAKPNAVSNNDCKSCHTNIGTHGAEQSDKIKTSVHNNVIGGCTGCHDRTKSDETKPVKPSSKLATIPGDNTCFKCHTSGGTAPDVQASFNKTVRHKTNNCADCHNPHIANKDTAKAPAIDGSQKQVTGLAVTNGLAGTSPTFTLLTSANNQHEICFKCHSNNSFNPNGNIPAGTSDKAIEFNANNVSFHPVQTTGKNLGIKAAAFTAGTPWSSSDYSKSSAKTYCTDCHGSDSASEPKGAHGSSNQFLLKKKFSLSGYWSSGYRDSSGETAASELALCFNCHKYDVYYNGAAGSRFSRHKYHIQDKNVACYACHEPHGRPDSKHLIRVQSVTSPGVRSYSETSSGGSCSASCHSSKSYTVNYPRVSN